MRLTLSTAPTADPVALVEVREWLNITPGIDDDDSVIQRLINQAYDELESMTNRKFLAQTWVCTLDASEIKSTIRLPLVPLVSVSSIKTTDDDGDETTVTATNYQVRAGENPRITLTLNGEWPSDARDYDSMAITCVCGYAGAVVPFLGWEPASTTTSTINDMAATLSDTWEGTVRTTYEFKITTAAATDKFDWRAVTTDGSGVKTYGAWTTAVSITGEAQEIEKKLIVTFDATTGHTLADQWTAQMYERLDERVRGVLQGLALYYYSTKGSGITETVSGQLIGMPRHLERNILSMRVEAW